MFNILVKVALQTIEVVLPKYFFFSVLGQYKVGIMLGRGHGQRAGVLGAYSQLPHADILLQAALYPRSNM